MKYLFIALYIVLLYGVASAGTITVGQPTAAAGGATAPSFRSVSAVSTGSGDPDNNIVLNAPSGIQDGDILLAEIAGYFVNTPTWPSGWTQYYSLTGNISTGHRYVYCAWKRASSESGNYTVTNLTDHGGSFYGRVHAYSGGKSSGTPVDVYAGDSDTGSTTVTFPTLDPTQAPTLVIAIPVEGDFDHTFSNFAGGGITWTNRVTASTFLGLANGEATGDGALTDITATASSADNRQAIIVNLIGQ